MKSKLIFSLLALFMMFSMTSCYEKIDAGHEGIKVNLYGSDKGVDDVSLVTGIVWYNPWTTTVYEYPTYVQTVDYDPFEFNSKDGSKFTFDPTIMISVKPGSSPEVFKKYRKDMDHVINYTLVPIVQDAFKEEINSRSDNELISNQTEFQNAIETRLSAELLKENFIVSKVTTGIKYPGALLDAITAKNKAIQDKAKVDNEVLVAKAEAEKVLVKAKAEAEANKLREQALTPAILKKMWIEKWDGKLPTVSSDNNMMLNLKDLK